MKIYNFYTLMLMSFTVQQISYYYYYFNLLDMELMR